MSKLTAEKYRDREAITDANFWDGNEIDFGMVYDFAEAYAQETRKERDEYYDELIEKRALVVVLEEEIKRLKQTNNPK